MTQYISKDALVAEIEKMIYEAKLAYKSIKTKPVLHPFIKFR